MKTFTESNLIFSFEEENWNIIQYDKKKNEMSVRAEKLKNKLGWLTTNISIDNIREQHFKFDGLNVNAVI